MTPTALDSDIRHKFELAGLGVAPFQFVRMEVRHYQACQDAPKLPGGTCAYCGEAIAECCFIRDSKGVEFMVGNVCVNKTGDAGLISLTKRALNRIRTEQRHAREAQRIAAGRELLARPEIREQLAARPHPFANNGEAFFAEKRLLDWADWMMTHAGNAGRIDVCRVVEGLAK